MVDMHMHTLYSDVDKTVEEVLSKKLDLGQVFRHKIPRIFINLSSFAWGVVINIKDNL